MNNGLYAFVKDDELFVVVCKPECNNEWNKLSELNGWEVESDDQFYIMGTDARAELDEDTKTLTYQSTDTIYFKCPVSSEVINFLKLKQELGFFLIQSETLIDAESVFTLFANQEIEGLICAFYTEDRKKNIFELDEEGNIIGLK